MLAKNILFEHFRELSNIGYNFINTKRIICTQGKYPKALLEKWDDFKKTKVSENDRPGKDYNMSHVFVWSCYNDSMIRKTHLRTRTLDITGLHLDETINILKVKVMIYGRD